MLFSRCSSLAWSRGLEQDVSSKKRTGFIILIAIQQIGNEGAAFLAGYSIDSFLGLFLVRFTDTTSQNVAKWGSQNLPKSTRQQVADVLAQSPKSVSPTLKVQGL
jgi:hypothetical protein